MKHNAQRIKITLEVILIQFVIVYSMAWHSVRRNALTGMTLRRYQISLVPRSSKIGGGEGLVHTVSACAL